MDDNNSLFFEFREDEGERGFYRGIEVAVEKGEGNRIWEVGGGIQIREESFFDFWEGEVFTFELFYHFAFCNKKFARPKGVSGRGRIFRSFFWESSKRIIEPERFLGRDF